MPLHEDGRAQSISPVMRGSVKTSAQEITCQPPRVRESFAPSA
jgi:hypothetical protein